MFLLDCFEFQVLHFTHVGPFNVSPTLLMTLSKTILFIPVGPLHVFICLSSSVGVAGELLPTYAPLREAYQYPLFHQGIGPLFLIHFLDPFACFVTLHTLIYRPHVI